MTSALAEALDRTLLLMRDNLVPEVSDTQLINALTGTTVALVGTVDQLKTHSAQCAYVTAAILMARSAHRIYLVAPDAHLVGAQPPLDGSRLITALVDVGRDLLPGVEFSVGLPPGTVNVAAFLGDSHAPLVAEQVIYMNATDWSAQLAQLGSSERPQPWRGDTWPLGGLAAGALVATEVFKHSMRQLRTVASDANLFDELFAPVELAGFELAPPGTPKVATLGEFDLISAGAIAHATLFALARLPNIQCEGRVMDREQTDLSNLNRYTLMRRSHVDFEKVSLLHALMVAGLRLQPIPELFDAAGVSGEALRPRALVGVDDIPTRWKVQAADPQWLGIGATTHWSVLVSHHPRGLGCAHCLHSRDDADRSRIPTAPFVSFMAGLQLASYFVREAAGDAVAASEQQVYFSPLRPERAWRSPVFKVPTCPTCSLAQKAA